MVRKLIIILIFVLPAFADAQKVHIGEQTFHFNDNSRNRPIVTELWYPTDEMYQKSDSTDYYPFIHLPTIKNARVNPGHYPIVFISHGTGGGRKTLEWLADILVEQGFMVAAVDHWGNTYDNKIAINFVTPWERPQDISFALTQLLNDQTFGPLINHDRIGAAGFSLGGYTVLALAGAKISLDALLSFSETAQGKKELNIPEYPGILKELNKEKVKESFLKSPDLKDSRFKAFFAMSPALGQGFTESEQFKTIKSPVYIIGAQSDSIAPIKTNALYYNSLIPTSKIIVIPGLAGHYVFLNEATPLIKKQVPFLFVDAPSVKRYTIHQQVGNLAADFFSKNLKH